MTSLILNSLLKPKIACSISQQNTIQARQFWTWLNKIWNSYDTETTKKVGPNIAAAQWLLRCGASVKFVEYPEWITDYSLITSSRYDNMYIEAFNTNESCVDASGFEYLNGLIYLKDIFLMFSPNVTDECLQKIAKYSAESLRTLTISDCYEITQEGLFKYLPNLHKLQKLKLRNVPQNPKPAFKDELKAIMPKDCTVEIEMGKTPEAKK